MSYLARAVSTRRLALATSIDSMKTLRCFSVSFSHQKGPIETTKETLKKVDRTVSNVAVKGIETGGMPPPSLSFTFVASFLPKVFPSQ